jgi:type IX secretion system PorP/SprF family membrane protein
MKPIYRLTLSAFLALAIMNGSFAQDIHFSQIFETPLYRNPALAGIVNADIRVQAVFRTQWNSFVNGYKTGLLNAEYKVPAGKGDDFITVGLQTLYDRAGTTNLTTTIIMPVLNYHKSMSQYRNMYLSVAFMGGFVNRNLDRSKIITDNQYNGGGDDGETFGKMQYSYLDGGTGISFNSGIGKSERNNIVIGVAYHHFNKAKNSFFQNANIRLDPKWVFSGDIKLAVMEGSWVTIQSNYSRQGIYQEAIGGILYSMNIGPLLDDPDYVLHGGLFVRWKDAVIPVVKFDYHPFSFAFSYDINTSRLKTASYGRGGVEFSLSYSGFLDRENSSVNAVRCPRF